MRRILLAVVLSVALTAPALAADLVVLGDSIGVGVGAAARCETLAKVGIGSAAYAHRMMRPVSASVVAVSLGANDDIHAATAANLEAVRSLISAHTIIWMMPASPPSARAAVSRVASAHGDAIIDTAPAAGPDRLHPTGAGYRRIADAIRAIGATR